MNLHIWSWRVKGLLSLLGLYNLSSKFICIGIYLEICTNSFQNSKAIVGKLLIHGHQCKWLIICLLILVMLIIIETWIGGCLREWRIASNPCLRCKCKWYCVDYLRGRLTPHRCFVLNRNIFTWDVQLILWVLLSLLSIYQKDFWCCYVCQTFPSKIG